MHRSAVSKEDLTPQLNVGIVCPTRFFTMFDHGEGSRGARRPGWQGLKAKPVRVRRCPATVTGQYPIPGIRYQVLGIRPEARSPASAGSPSSRGRGGSTALLRRRPEVWMVWLTYPVSGRRQTLGIGFRTRLARAGFFVVRLARGVSLPIRRPVLPRGSGPFIFVTRDA